MTALMFFLPFFSFSAHITQPSAATPVMLSFVKECRRLPPPPSPSPSRPSQPLAPPYSVLTSITEEVTLQLQRGFFSAGKPTLIQQSPVVEGRGKLRCRRGERGQKHFQVGQSQSILRKVEGKKTEGFRKQLMRPTAREYGALVGVFAVHACTHADTHGGRRTRILASRVM